MKIHPAYYLFALLSAIYAGSYFFIPVDPAAVEAHQLAPGQVMFLLLTIILPIIGIWLIACYGFVELSRYSRKIKNSRDGKAFKSMSIGVGILAISLPIMTLFTRLLNWLSTRSPDGLPLNSLAGNFVRPLLLAIAFYFIYKGVCKLEAMTKDANPHNNRLLFVLLYMLAIVPLAYISIAKPRIVFPFITSLPQLASIPDELLAGLLVFAYSVIWFFGFLAAYGLYEFKKNVAGNIYKKAIGYLALGLAVITVSSIYIQYATLVIGAVPVPALFVQLLFIYILLVIMSVGYLLVARGARYLTKIEEV